MNATRWVYSLVAVVAVALLSWACGAAGPAPGTPEALYVDLGCAKCHGPDREGQRSGPPLHNLADRWDEETLIRYLEDPKAVVEVNPRLKYIAEGFPIKMPGYADKNQEDLRKLAVFMLES